MIITIAKQEITAAFRDKRILSLLVIVLVLLGLSVYISHIKYSQLENYRAQAANEKREQWLHQDPKHPHVAAHFGNFAFKPVTPLNWIDYGVDNYTGTYVYMEPHRQNDFIFTPAQELNASIRFGELSPALILQVFVPLLIIFTCFAAVSRERESGTLRLLHAQGTSMYQLVSGKILGYFFILLVVLLPLVAGIFFTIQPGGTNAVDQGDISTRFLLLLLAYLVYFLILISIVVLVSALVKTSRTSMLVSLGIWICLVVIIPKATANLGADLYALPSNEAFTKAIRNDIKNGIDGHDPDTERKKQLMAAMLKKYGVDSESKLPVNMEGVVMQVAEAYSSKVYDKHFGKVQEVLADQNKLSSWASFINPYLAIRNISMSLSLTDVYSHVDFQRSAENYRREFVQYMNGDMAENSKPGSFFTYKVDDKTYTKIRPFAYTLPPLSFSAKNVTTEITALVLLLLAFLFITRFLINKISIL